MQYTKLGRTGLKVSRLCLGTMNFGPETTEADSFTIMDRALEQGINFFDTADVYGWARGEGRTEQIASAACYRGAADHHRRDDLKFKAHAGVGFDGRVAGEIEQSRRGGHYPHQDKRSKDD